MNTQEVSTSPDWHRKALLAAGIYNIAWGSFTVLFPNAFFEFAGMAPPSYPEIWQCVGMIVGVYGLGYVIAASDPVRHWPIVLVGLLGKVFGPIGFLWSYLGGTWTATAGLTIITNDLIWWYPFSAVLLHAAFVHQGSYNKSSTDDLSKKRKAQLLEESFQYPLLLLFLRHTGCVFCHQSLKDLGKRRAVLEQEGIQLKLIHMSEQSYVEGLLMRYGLTGIDVISDKRRGLYRAFGLTRSLPKEIFTFRALISGIKSVILTRFLVGPLRGDGFQRGGAFLVRNGTIEQLHRSGDITERVPFDSALA